MAKGKSKVKDPRRSGNPAKRAEAKITKEEARSLSWAPPALIFLFVLSFGLNVYAKWNSTGQVSRDDYFSAAGISFAALAVSFALLALVSGVKFSRREVRRVVSSVLVVGLVFGVIAALFAVPEEEEVEDPPPPIRQSDLQPVVP